MPAETTDPNSALADLEQRVLNGDATVTAAALAKARSEVELAELRTEAQRREAEAQAAEAALTATQTCRDEVLPALESQLDRARTAYQDTVTALRVLRVEMDEYASLQRQGERRFHRAGIQEELAAFPPIDAKAIHADAVLEAAGEPRSNVGTPRRPSAPYRHLLHSDEAYAELRAGFEERAAANDRRMAAYWEQKRADRAAAIEAARLHAEMEDELNARRIDRDALAANAPRRGPGGEGGTAA